jgi:hypothetical protein
MVKVILWPRSKICECRSWREQTHAQTEYRLSFRLEIEESRIEVGAAAGGDANFLVWIKICSFGYWYETGEIGESLLLNTNYYLK